MTAPHWDAVYSARAVDHLSWTRPDAGVSARLVDPLLDDAAAVVDVGGGAGLLVDHLLATGRRTLKAGSGASSMNQGQVASVLGSLLASQAKKALSAKVPLDVFSIESGDEGLAGTRVEVGKYFTDKLYLGGRGRLGGQSVNQSTTRPENTASVVSTPL